MKLNNFFPCKKAYYVKKLDFFPNFCWKTVLLWSSYGTATVPKLSIVGTGTVTCQRSEPEPKK